MIPKRDRNAAMRIIIAACTKDDRPFKASDLTQMGLSKRIDPVAVCQVLSGEGYIYWKPASEDAPGSVTLTGKGRCYFEHEDDERRAFWRNSILTPILVSIATTIAINLLKPMWLLIQEWALQYL